MKLFYFNKNAIWRVIFKLKILELLLLIYLHLVMPPKLCMFQLKCITYINLMVMRGA